MYTDPFTIPFVYLVVLFGLLVHLYTVHNKCGKLDFLLYFRGERVKF